MKEFSSFAEMIEWKRKLLGITIMDVSNAIGMSASRYNDVEKGRLKPPSKKVMIGRICKVLQFNEQEKDWLLRQACFEKRILPSYLNEYVYKQSPSALKLLETIKEMQLSDAAIEALIKKLKALQAK